MTNQITRRWGWIADLPDFRDHFTTKGVIKRGEILPPKVDLEDRCPPVINQGSLGSCTACSVTAMCRFVLGKQDADDREFSPLFLYYNTRLLEDSVALDNGATLRDTLKVVNKTGVASEQLWPYDPARYAFAPGVDAYQEAEKYQSIAYEKVVQGLQTMKALLFNGFPFVFGFSVFSSFYDIAGESPIMPVPSSSDQFLGGHAVMCVGYDNEKLAFKIRNSWGPDWGENGYFYMPYVFILDPKYAKDFWTIRLMEEGV